MKHVVIVGGGWAGCAAAVAAVRQGVQVTLLERTDLLLGTGLVGGIYRNNGRLTALLEAQALGCGQLFELMDRIALHRSLDFPGHRHAALYDVTRIETLVRKFLLEQNIQIRVRARVTDVVTDSDHIAAVTISEKENLEADAFVETTGSAGGMSNCTRFGNGCAMCIIRCPSFGSRVSIAGKAGVMEVMGTGPNGRPGSMSGSCKLLKESLAPALQQELTEKGQLILPLPTNLNNAGADYKACQQYNLPAYKDNLILLDTGHAKLMTPYVPLDTLRQVAGLEEARYLDPYAGDIGNSIRFVAVTPRDNRLVVEGLKNLLCAGEKAGYMVGHTEAVITGSLAGYNAAALVCGKPLLELPDTLAGGDFITAANPSHFRRGDKAQRMTFSGADYFVRMQEKQLYLTSEREVTARVKQAGLINVFARFM